MFHPSVDRDAHVQKGAKIGQVPEHTFSLWNRYDFGGVVILRAGDFYGAGRGSWLDLVIGKDDRPALGEPLEYRAHRDDDAGLQRAGVEGAGTGRAEVDAE